MSIGFPLILPVLLNAFVVKSKITKDCDVYRTVKNMAKTKPWSKKEREEWQKRMDELDKKLESGTYLRSEKQIAESKKRYEKQKEHMSGKTTLTISMPIELKEKFNEQLKKDKMSASEVLIVAIHQYLDK